MTRIFYWFFYEKDGSHVRLYIRLVFTLPPRDSTLQYKRCKRCVHFWNNFPCITSLVDPMSSLVFTSKTSFGAGFQRVHRHHTYSDPGASQKLGEIIHGQLINRSRPTGRETCIQVIFAMFKWTVNNTKQSWAPSI